VPLLEVIDGKLRAALGPEHLVLVNESYMHSVPAGSETHWNLIVVSTRFEGASRVDRQRLVNAALADELARGAVHALTMKTLTPAEWQAAGGAVTNAAPLCKGGSKG
jgi:stress-induced morphogen